MMRELIRIHQNEIPVRFCPDSWFPCELFTSFCYADYYHYGDPMSIPCDGDGYCVQNYKYCWDNSESPWTLNVVKVGSAMNFEEDCDLPFIPGPAYQIIHDCIPWCGN